MNGPESLRTSPLHAVHVEAGAKFGPFAGWLMPLEYAEGGVVVEHRAVREGVGLFDVSHLGTAVVAGPGARDLINGLMTNDLSRIGLGRAQYTLLCDNDGGVVDDLLVYLRADDDVLLIPNAANSGAVLAVVAAEASADITVTDLHQSMAIIAVQGPSAPALMEAVGLPFDLPYMAFVDTEWDLAGSAVPITVCRTGYTGERGYEVLVPADNAEAAWRALMSAGVPLGVRPCGLASRDTLRTEMGYPLHGQDLGPAITPVMAGLSWAVGWTKPVFRGREALLAERERGAGRTLRGLLAQGRGVPRADMVVKDHTGRDVGRVTSGTFSPSRGTGIALALLDPEVRLDAEVTIDLRGRALPATVVNPPFVESSPRGPLGAAAAD